MLTQKRTLSLSSNTLESLTRLHKRGRETAAWEEKENVSAAPFVKKLKKKKAFKHSNVIHDSRKFIPATRRQDRLTLLTHFTPPRSINKANSASAFGAGHFAVTFPFYPLGRVFFRKAGHTLDDIKPDSEPDLHPRIYQGPSPDRSQMITCSNTP